MDNPTFVDEENNPMVNQDKDYEDNYRRPCTSRVDETSFMGPDATKTTSTLRLRQKLKRDKIVSLYRYLDVTADPGLADLDRFMIRKNLWTGNIELLFLDGNKHWQSLTNKRTGEFLVPRTLREKFGGLNKMKSVLSLDETQSALARSISAASKIKTQKWATNRLENGKYTPERAFVLGWRYSC